jgi:outer membrane protein
MNHFKYSIINNKTLMAKSDLLQAVSGFIFVFLFSFGCISEKVNQDESLFRYQENLTHKEQRQNIDYEEPNNILDILKPVTSREDNLPELNFTTDSNTGEIIVNLTIEEVIQKALANSPEIRVVSFDPTVSRLDITKAASEFDVTAFGNINYENEDNPLNSIFQSGQSNSRSIDAGIKQKLITGSEWSLTYAFARNWDDLAGRLISSRYEPILSFQLRQPLLRDAWEDLNLAGIDIAKLNYKIAMLGFRQKAEDITTEVISSYWRLVQAKRNIAIYKDLLNQTLETLNKVQGRRQIDATDVQIQQAQAYVKSRQASLIQAEKQVLDEQDKIVRLLSDSKLNLLEKFNIVPVSQPVTEVTELDINKLLETTLQKNPVVQQARVGIEIAEVNVRIANNQKMPRLDLVSSLRTQSLDAQPYDAYARMYNGDYVSYGVGLSLEYPLGNRKRETELIQRRLARRKAAVNLENIADQAAQVTKERVRRIETDYLEIEKQRAATEAARLHLKVLEESEIIREKLTPEFLMLKLQAQEFLANAQTSEIRAIADYNIALAELSHINGTVLELHLVEPKQPESTETKTKAETEIEFETDTTNNDTVIDNTNDELVPVQLN